MDILHYSKPWQGENLQPNDKVAILELTLYAGDVYYIDFVNMMIKVNTGAYAASADLADMGVPATMVEVQGGLKAKISLESETSGKSRSFNSGPWTVKWAKDEFEVTILILRNLEDPIATDPTNEHITDHMTVFATGRLT